MRGRSGHWFGYGAFGSPALLWVAIVVGAAAVGAVVIWLILRRRPAGGEEKKLTLAQRDTLNDFEAQVLALLTQRGGEADQTVVVAALGLPVNIVAERLLEMESSGMIERRWSADRLTYTVKRTVA